MIFEVQDLAHLTGHGKETNRAEDVAMGNRDKHREIVQEATASFNKEMTGLEMKTR